MEALNDRDEKKIVLEQLTDCLSKEKIDLNNIRTVVSIMGLGEEYKQKVIGSKEYNERIREKIYRFYTFVNIDKSTRNPKNREEFIEMWKYITLVKDDESREILMKCLKKIKSKDEKTYLMFMTEDSKLISKITLTNIMTLCKGKNKEIQNEDYKEVSIDEDELIRFLVMWKETKHKKLLKEDLETIFINFNSEYVLRIISQISGYGYDEIIRSVYKDVNYCNEKINRQQCFKLVRAGLLDENELIKAYLEQINQTMQKRIYREAEIKEKNSLTIEQVLEYFNPQKVIEKVNQYYNNGDNQSINIFLGFYRILLNNKLLEGDKGREYASEIQEKLLEILEKNNEYKNLNGDRTLQLSDKERMAIAIELLKSDILFITKTNNLEREKNQCSGEKIKNEYEILIELNVYKIFHERIATQEEVELFVAEAFEKDKLSDTDLLLLRLYRIISDEAIDLAYMDKPLTKSNIESKINEGILNGNLARLLFTYNRITDCSIENPDCEWLEGMEANWSAPIEMLGLLDKERAKMVIQRLYNFKLLTLEDIEKFCNKKIISSDMAQSIIEVSNVREKIEKLTSIISGESEENKNPVKEEKKKRKSGEKKTKERIPGEERKKFLEICGFTPLRGKNGDVLEVVAGAYKGYRIYSSIEYNSLIMEKQDDNGATTVIMNIAKFMELVRIEGNVAMFNENRGRSQLKKDERETMRLNATPNTAQFRNHSRNWTENIIESMLRTSTLFQFENEEERNKYIKEEKKRILKRFKDLKKKTGIDPKSEIEALLVLRAENNKYK
jgi:hypothetical protein